MNDENPPAECVVVRKWYERRLFDDKHKPEPYIMSTDRLVHLAELEKQTRRIEQYHSNELSMEEVVCTDDGRITIYSIIAPMRHDIDPDEVLDAVDRVIASRQILALTQTDLTYDERAEVCISLMHNAAQWLIESKLPDVRARISACLDR